MITAVANNGTYDAIIVTHSSTDRLIIPGLGESIETATTDGLVSAWSALPKIPIIAIRDNPIPRSDVIQCVTQYKSTAADKCAVTRAAALRFDGQAEAARGVHNARVVDVTDLYCTATICPPVIGNVLVYRDPSHITATYAATLAPYLRERIAAAIDS